MDGASDRRILPGTGPRVLHLTSVHRPFDNRIFFKECRSLAASGYEVTLTAPADFDSQVRDGVRVIGLNRPRRRWQRPRLWWNLLRRAAALRPDLVHFHDPELLLIVPWLRLSLGNRVPIVYDVHEYFVDSLAHKVWIPPWLRRPTAWVARRLERTLGRFVDGLVFVVPEQAPLYGGWRAAHAVVHNYPGASAFANATPLPQLPADRFRLIYIGSLYARRGMMTMLQALARIVPHAPETLLILGGVFESDAFRAQVEEFIAAQNLAGHVTILGWIDPGQLKDYLASADVAWLPELPVKQYQRPAVSTKLLESMLMGLPVVSSDLPDRRPLVEASGCGFLVTAEDPQAHAEAILWLSRHPEERRAMAERGRKLVLERYTWEGESQVLMSLYRRLLGLEKDWPGGAWPAEPAGTAGTVTGPRDA